MCNIHTLLSSLKNFRKIFFLSFFLFCVNRCVRVLFHPIVVLRDLAHYRVVRLGFIITARARLGPAFGSARPGPVGQAARLPVRQGRQRPQPGRQAAPPFPKAYPSPFPFLSPLPLPALPTLPLPAPPSPRLPAPPYPARLSSTRWPARGTRIRATVASTRPATRRAELVPCPCRVLLCRAVSLRAASVCESVFTPPSAPSPGGVALCSAGQHCQSADAVNVSAVQCSVSGMRSQGT